jgi:hypothetical protein
MIAPRASLGFLAASAAVLALPAAAPAEPVPPGNSAATQYTEAFPTAGGPQNAERGQKGNHRQPAKVLGPRNARRLESQGAAGREAAAVAAETAPGEGAARSAGSGRSGQRVGASAGEGDIRGHGQPSDNSVGGSDGGSSLGEVIRQASGSSSSDGTGLLLPLAIAGAIIWSFAYLMRRRKNPTE